MRLQESGEMYLETIYVLSRKSKDVHSVDVGEYMGYSKPSVSRAIGLLKEGGFVQMGKDGALTLTE
ncbi:MAG: metal-dependent transcriptional regulator, partial [Clostridia bacterium]|nr:metal-dependent transcriptional regulator [Clostridia bacterium]